MFSKTVLNKLSKRISNKPISKIVKKIRFYSTYGVIEHEKAFYLTENGKKICAWKGIKSKEVDQVGRYNFVTTSVIKSNSPAVAFEPLVITETTEQNKFALGNQLENNSENEEKILKRILNHNYNKTKTEFNANDPLPLIPRYLEKYTLGTQLEGLSYECHDIPFYPPFNKVKTMSEELEIPFKQWSIGYIPQTFEDKNYIVDPSEEAGNDRPLQAIVLDSNTNIGDVSQIKVLTAFGLYDKTYEGADRPEFSWYVIGIPVDSPLADSTNDLEELQWNFPWYLAGIRMYLTHYPNFKVNDVGLKRLAGLINFSTNPTVVRQFDSLSYRLFGTQVGNLRTKKVPSKEIKTNDWFAVGQPQYTVDALSIVEKSIKKFNLKFK